MRRWREGFNAACDGLVVASEVHNAAGDGFYRWRWGCNAVGDGLVATGEVVNAAGDGF